LSGFWICCFEIKAHLRSSSPLLHFRPASTTSPTPRREPTKIETSDEVLRYRATLPMELLQGMPGELDAEPNASSFDLAFEADLLLFFLLSGIDLWELSLVQPLPLKTTSPTKSPWPLERSKMSWFVSFPQTSTQRFRDASAEPPTTFLLRSDPLLLPSTGCFDDRRELLHRALRPSLRQLNVVASQPGTLFFALHRSSSRLVSFSL